MLQYKTNNPLCNNFKIPKKSKVFGKNPNFLFFEKQKISRNSMLKIIFSIELVENIFKIET